MTRLKIIQDELKQQYTSHWDLDYITTAQMETAFHDNRRQAAAEKASVHGKSAARTHSWWNRLAFRLKQLVPQSK
jgi:hypothetical protein